MKKKLKMKLFGKFSLASDEHVLSEEELNSAKMTCLLGYILINRDCALTHQRLIEVFWEGPSKNPEGTLKNLVYRIRTALKALGDEQYICTASGTYGWNPEIEVETDYEQFEQIYTLLCGTQEIKDAQEKKQLCQEALDIYQGNVCPRIAECGWILPRVTRYQSMYIDIVKVLCEIFEEEKEWSQLENLCWQALEVDAFEEEIHYWLMESLYGQRKLALLMNHYENTRKLFYESMGIRIPERLQNLFYKIMTDTEEGFSTGLEQVLLDMKEQEKPQEAFLCDYQIFRQLYQIEARRINRLGIAEYVLLFTVRRKGRSWQAAGVDAGIAEGMDVLEKLLRNSLRAGDVISRYSQSRFIVMLPTCSYEAGIKVAKRIQEMFHKNIGSRHLEVQAEMAELSATEKRGGCSHG
ncbi:MAG: hypothetical protein MR871_14105 [Lachnospiraceae bacterium]|nr:hypothetical protein [Lachnospiraceae bacterium]